MDHLLRDVSTAARQWAVARTAAARDSFAMACLVLADAVDEQTAEEERELLPLLAALPAEQWSAITAAAGCALSGEEQMFVLGLALEDAVPGRAGPAARRPAPGGTPDRLAADRPAALPRGGHPAARRAARGLTPVGRPS